MNIDHAKEEFYNYVKKYNLKNNKIKLKYDHSLRVCDLSMELATFLNLSSEDIFIAGLIGLLHDLGRFEQVKLYDSWNDAKTFDHAEWAIKVLFEDNLIRTFIDSNLYDDIIKKAIFSHNKFILPESYDDKQLLFAKIIRDADKLDIFYLVVTKQIIYDIKNEVISEKVLEAVNNKQSVNIKDIKSDLDAFICYLALIHDLNIKYSFYIVKKEDYINKMINTISLKDENTRMILNDIKNKLYNYVEMRLGGK